MLVLYPTCLSTSYKCLSYSDLPQTTITKSINDLHKRLNSESMRFSRWWTFWAI